MSFRNYILLILTAFSMMSFTLVIDAGHGGKDPGALGNKIREKDVNLDVALRLGKLVKDSLKDVDCFLTRKTDVFLTLQERADFVNKHNADFFICIHANSAENKKLYGAETYVLGLHKMESNLQVAMRENSVMMLEDNYQTKYQGFDPNSVESYIMFEFMQDRFIDKSLQFASLVQHEFSSTLQRTDRGVRQAGFWVLHKSACPSVLVEMGFVSNPDEEKYLASEKGKQEIAQALFDAFVHFYKPQQTPSNANEQPQQTQTVSEQTQKTEVQTTQQQTAENVADKSTNSETISKPTFRVQIFSVKAPLKAGDASFKGLKNCSYTKDGSYYKYTYGDDSDYQKIAKLKAELVKKFPDCFIVAFKDGKQITVKNAMEMLK